MLRIYDCITGQHDLRYVAVAGFICLFASYTAISLLIRARVAEDRARLAWLGGAAVVAGAGIWATHFVAMLAFRQNVPVGYDVALTVLSIVIAVLLTWCGYRIALAPRGSALLGGGIAGLAVASMHYAGMAAVRMPAEARWDAGYVVASIVIGAVLCAAALRMTAAREPSFRRRIAGATLYVLGIVGLHFTAMAAVTYVPDPRIPLPDEIMNPEWLSVAVALVTVLIVSLGFVGSIVDQHLADRSVREAERLRRYVAELETTRAQLEATTRTLTRALDEAAAGSQAKSQFLATMSHELRTPLNAVIGFSDMLANETFGPLGDQRYRDYAKSICDSGAHLLGLINDILDISKLDAGALELDEREIDLSSIIRDAVRMLEHQARSRGISLTEDLAQTLPRIRGDERRMRQVLINLLSNALKFTQRDGSVGIVSRLEANAIVIEVTDTGIGIAPEDIPRALERFGQVDDTLGRRYEGTGLGLPLSKSLMELHGGTLELESAVGVGTTVTVTIPANRIVPARQVA